jgi:hypothetical protein
VKMKLVTGLAIVSAGVSVATTASATPEVRANTCTRGSMHLVYNGAYKCLSRATRKRIYWQLTYWQDRHPGQDVQAYYAIARRWRISLIAVKKIAFEGASHNWPLPPLP